MLICPFCSGTLIATDATLTCPRGHTFDVAREGYVNLLVGGAHGAAGDTKEMLRARRAFLERGFYAPLSERLNTLAAEPTFSGRAVGARQAAPAGVSGASLVLDAGCGDGYYLGRMREALHARDNTSALTYVGIDIAKEAARLAAKRYPAIRFAVADLKRGIPVATGSVALLLNVFAPRNPAEFARIVAPGGILLIAIPGPRHLAELRERYGLIGIEPEKDRHIVTQLAEAFAPAGASTLEYVVDLTGEDVRQLLTMTPNARHRERQLWKDAALEAAQATASFHVLAFRHRT